MTQGTFEDGMQSSKAIDWNKTALLVIDMQNDFFLPGGPMHVAAIVSQVQKALEVAHQNAVFVVWVIREEHFRKHLYDGKAGPTAKGEYGAALVDGLVPQPGEQILNKYRMSAFFATNLDMVLRQTGISSLVIAGVQTLNCIRATVLDALALDYQVTVLADATAAATPEIHTANLLDMRNVGVATPTLAQWSDALVMCPKCMLSVFLQSSNKPPQIYHKYLMSRIPMTLVKVADFANF